jgi:hypothetical protein
MRTTSIIAAAAIALGLALPQPERGLAAGAGPFDGTWNVEVVCPDVGDVRGYDWRFPAQVSSGVLTGHYHSPTTPAMGDFSGRIRPDGSALITVVARTGPEEYAVGHLRPGTPFRYTANVHFDAHSGFGKRNELRPCTLAFTKS